MDTIEFMASPGAFGRVEFTVVQSERSVWRVRIKTKLEAGDSGKVCAQRGRGQGAVTFQRYLHKILAFALAHRNILLDVFHCASTSGVFSPPVYSSERVHNVVKSKRRVSKTIYQNDRKQHK